MPRFRAFPRFRILRTARLGALGRAAVAGVCLIGTAVGYGVGVLAGLPVAWSVPVGAAVGPLAIVVADRRRWNRMWTGYGWSATAGETRRVADELRRAGVAVEVDGRRGGTGIRVRNRDRRRVSRVLVDLGIRPPRW